MCLPPRDLDPPRHRRSVPRAAIYLEVRVQGSPGDNSITGFPWTLLPKDNSPSILRISQPAGALSPPDAADCVPCRDNYRATLGVSSFDRYRRSTGICRTGTGLYTGSYWEPSIQQESPSRAVGVRYSLVIIPLLGASSEAIGNIRQDSTAAHWLVVAPIARQHRR